MKDKDVVSDLIESYETSVSMIRELVDSIYSLTVAFDQSSQDTDNERARLREILENLLGKNCSLRKKDFRTLMKRVLLDADAKRREIEQERKKIAEELRKYLDQQKQVAAALRHELVESTGNKPDRHNLKSMVGSIKSMYRGKGQEVFVLLRDFQLKLEALKREEKEINHELQRLVERGESLRIQDVREIKSAGLRQERRALRESRLEEVKTLLDGFKQKRAGYRRGSQK